MGSGFLVVSLGFHCVDSAGFGTQEGQGLGKPRPQTQRQKPSCPASWARRVETSGGGLRARHQRGSCQAQVPILCTFSLSEGYRPHTATVEKRPQPSLGRGIGRNTSNLPLRPAHSGTEKMEPCARHWRGLPLGQRPSGDSSRGWNPICPLSAPHCFSTVDISEGTLQKKLWLPQDSPLMGLDFRTCLCLGQRRPGGSVRAAGAAGQGRLLLPPEQHLSPGPRGLAWHPGRQTARTLSWAGVRWFCFLWFCS